MAVGRKWALLVLELLLRISAARVPFSFILDKMPVEGMQEVE